MSKGLLPRGKCYTLYDMTGAIRNVNNFDSCDSFKDGVETFVFTSKLLVFKIKFKAWDELHPWIAKIT